MPIPTVHVLSADGAGEMIEQLLRLAPFAPSPCQQASPLSQFSPTASANNQASKELFDDIDKIVTLVQFQHVVAALTHQRHQQARSPARVDGSFLGCRTPSLSPHPSPAVQSKAQLFCCKQCNFVTRHRGNLPTHMLRHSGERPHACSKCPKRFTTSSSRKRHEMSQHNSEGRVRKNNNDNRGPSPEQEQHDMLLDFLFV
ncbi:hypothetical protein CcCBS67573_g03311 [Chytriomyces confervae]|uniref:C2H2-type domain-containing protein n=1 Tax=Chytriomyces confervae TaxID=246404 RepID=A0A507FI68_9FUNG|nr:hypothetical protein CcCBS67573_g03311 [Chytriomyces confervae]